MIPTLKSPVFLRSFILLVMLFTFAGAAYSWTSPTGTPPDNNVSAPINVGSLSQAKSGPLQVNGFLNLGSSYMSGSVGIGISDPPNKLHVNGSIGATGWIGAGCEGSCEGSGGYSLLYADGRVVSTNSVNSPAFYYTSDESLKYNIKDIQNATDIISQLRGVTFNWHKDGRADVGLIAQEVEDVLPELVHTDSTTGLKSVEYANLIAPLIEAIKEQQREIETLRQQVSELQDSLN